MEGGYTSPVESRLTGAREELWAAEIRDYLLGRLATPQRVEDLGRRVSADMSRAPVRRWWMFEGKRYTPLGGGFRENWERVDRLSRQLLSTFNPRLKIGERLEGSVDWAQTFARGCLPLRPEYVVRSSSVGLDEEQRTALLKWGRWIRAEWAAYASKVGLDPSLEQLRWAEGDDAGDTGPEGLRRCAHVARRSRWPFMRDVVAESLRPLFEADEVYRIPLPRERETLFELLCLVRICRTLSPLPDELRWLDLETQNRLDLPGGLQCFYQESLSREDVLASTEYAGALALAIGALDVAGIPKRVDLAFDFKAPRSGFAGIIVEAKSGARQYADTIHQLRTYRAARRRKPGRYLIWGIVETAGAVDADRSRVKALIRDSAVAEDLWVFSSADAIELVLNTLFQPVSSELNSIELTRQAHSCSSRDII